MPGAPLLTRDSEMPGAWSYSVMRKVAMAISGLVLVAFLYGHWAGNTVLLSGEQAFNDYLDWLRNHPILHYGVWIAIALALLVHVAVGPRHWLTNRMARPRRYRKRKLQATTWAARTMMASGTFLLIFLGVHIAHVRGWLVFDDTTSTFQNLRAGFAYWPVLTLYVVAQVALALHLYHGLWSQFQTLGLHHPRYNHLRRPFAFLVGAGLAILNIGLILLNTGAGQQLIGSAT
ncbi:MAG: succinate dehydrogenase cytochrome b subunit [Gammaproteobacteria bacterium]|nr:succinate dehydrogenase cytochrome b subunit [Gammaproteobacteria bacterium]